MFDKIIGTIGTRIAGAALSFLIMILNARLLGPENVGTIGLIIFSIAIIQLFVNFFSGGALIYQASRIGVYRLIITASIWSLAITLIASGLLLMLPYLHPSLELIPASYGWQVMTLTVIISLASVNLNLILGLEKVKQYNYISLMQIVIMFGTLLFMIYIVNQRDVVAYLVAFGVSWLVACATGWLVLRPNLTREPIFPLGRLLRDVLQFGTYVQVANIFQLFNYRLSLKFVDAFMGRAAVGILSTGMALAESLWIIARSIATVQMSRLSNQADQDYSVRLTMILLKGTIAITAVAMIILLLIPESFFSIIFTRQFTGLKSVISSLAAGIVLLSASIILSGFFSGINKPRFNTISSAIGFGLTCIFGWLLIPRLGLVGAGIAATLSYGSATLFQLVVFLSMSKLGWKDLLITKTDLILLYAEFRRKKINA